jgi:pyruvate dehydrogenase E2 component (dihydrolipoamide acetyltransferase)
MYEITVPKMGMDTTEVEILKWMIKVGDNIKKGDPVAEIEFGSRRSSI